ncbi:MAG: 23S rRNA (pseudouridine(1915)-N(3))-methyltransferase RlmH [Sphingomonadales bacterium]
MRIHIIAVGRMRAGPERELLESYVRRIGGPVAVREVEGKSSRSGTERRQRESDLLLGATPDRATVVALDENGAAPNSEAFARKIGNWRDSGVRDLAFLIGGADGHGAAVRQRADYTLSLGAMTWPHLLARVMLAEQLYRAMSILAGHPYHRS